MVSLVRVLLGVVVVVGIAVAVPPGWGPTIVTVTHGGGEPVEIEVNESVFNVSATAPAERMTPTRPAAIESTDTPESASSSIDGLETERLVLEKVNEIRRDRSLSDLEWSERAHRSADQHAEEMAEYGYFSHTSQVTGETQLERYSYCRGGENAHWYGGTYASPEAAARGVVQGWMSSDPHRERGLLNDRWESAGVGLAVSERGETYAVMGFCSR